MSLQPAPSCPFRGLAPYREEDAEFFYGRQAEVGIICANLIGTRFTVLYGESGVGKSSVLRAGVLPHLRRLGRRRSQEPAGPRFHPVLLSEWQGDVLAAIHRQMVAALGGPPSEGLKSVPAPGGFVAYLQAWTDALGAPLLLILDQFEEYLRAHGVSGSERSAFDDEFAAAVNRTDLRANFLVAMREDELARLDRYKGRVPGLLRNLLRLRHLSEPDARRAIGHPLVQLRRRHPGTQAPTKIEARLVSEILAGVRPERVRLGEGGVGTLPAGGPASPIQTPYLQLVLVRLWEEELHLGSRVLRLSTFRRLGGVEALLRQHIDTEMSGLPAEQRDLAAIAFRHLVTPSGAKVPLSARDLADLCEPAEVALSSGQPGVSGRPEPGSGPRDREGRFSLLLERLCSTSRILRPVPGLPGGGIEGRYEVSTDSLSPPILDWAGRHRREMESAAAEQRLQAERRETARFQRLAFALFAALLMAVGLGVFAWIKSRESLARQFVAQSGSTSVSAPVRGVSLAVEAVNAGRLGSGAVRGETERALRAALFLCNERPKPAGAPPGFNAGPPWRSADGRYELAREPGGDGFAVRLLDPAVPGRSTGQVTLRQGHTGEILGAAFARQGDRLATAESDGSVRVWTLGDGRCVASLGGGDYAVRAVEFSRDGTRIAGAGDDRIVRLWSWSDTNLLARFAGHSGRVNALAFDGSGAFLASASDDRTARVWDLESGECAAVLIGHTNEVRDVAFDRDNEHVWTRGGGGEVRYWDARMGRLLVAPANSAADRALVLAMSASGGGVQVCAARRDGVFVQRLTLAGVGNLSPSLAGSAQIAAFSRTGRFLAVVQTNRTVLVVDLKNPAAPVATWMEPTNLISIAFSAKDRALATLTADGSTRLWRWPARQSGSVVPGPAVQEGQVAFSADSRTLVISGGNRPRLVAVDPADPAAVLVGRDRVLQGHQHTVRRVAFSDDCRRVLTADLEGRAMVWEVSSGRRLATLDGPSGHADAVESAVFGPGDRYVATASADKSVRLWDLAQPEPSIAVLRGSLQAPLCLAWNPDRQTLLVGCGNGSVRSYSVAELQPLDALLRQASLLTDALLPPRQDAPTRGR